jgi:hypothetical protein
VTAAVAPDAERRHRPGDGPWWQEAWWFDFVSVDGRLGGVVRLALLPHQGVSWYWAGLVGAGRPLVSVVDDEAPLPPTALEVRAEGLWCDHTCEAPLDHWTIGLEAFGVALDDPAEAWRRAVGDRVALGLDLEWEATGPPWAPADGAGYSLPCTVVGQVLVGSERVDLDGFGHRGHAWGPDVLPAAPWWALSGRLDDGVAVAGTTTAGGALWTADGCVAGALHVDAPPGAELLGPVPGGLRARVGDIDLTVDVGEAAPVPVPRPGGRRDRLARARCRLQTRDGRRGQGWLRHLLPADGGRTAAGALP